MERVGQKKNFDWKRAIKMKGVHESMKVRESRWQPDLYSCRIGSQTPHSSDHAHYPKPNDATPSPPALIFGGSATTMPPEFNPYVSPSPAPKNELL
ncbi:hypothetical protein Bca101_060432 [Brassica carinata]